jgi:hypothetical protein
MKIFINTIVPLAALALSACSGSGSARDSSMPPPAGSSNVAPTITGLAASESLPQSSGGNPIAFQIADAETAAGQLEVSVSSSNEELIPVAGVAVAGNEGKRSLILWPEPGKSGTADITVSVKDAGGLVTTQTLPLTVTGQEQSFRDFALASMNDSEDAEPADLAGYSWVDKEENDPAAFDSVLSSVAE